MNLVKTLPIMLLLNVSPCFGSTLQGRQQLLALFERSCVVCHRGYLDANGNSDWDKILEAKDRILPRIDPMNQGYDAMPPLSAPEELKWSDEERKAAFQILAAAEPDTTISNPTKLPLDEIILPPGFKIQVYAVARGARSLSLAPDGTLFIGTGGFSNPDTKVYAAQDIDGDGYAEKVTILAQGLNNPNGVTFAGGNLYVAERSRILVFEDILKNLDHASFKTLFDGFPIQQSHSWKIIRQGPDQRLYVPVGAPCNICDTDGKEETAGKFSRIFSLDLEGNDFRSEASGVRNTVGFDWHPTSALLWFTDNGRDSLGDNLPPDELNVVSDHDQNLHFGYPYCHGVNIPDPLYGKGKDCASYEPPAMELGPHVAALGMRFYTGYQFPTAYRHQAFIAEHGSWNRSKPIGYRVTMVTIDDTGSKALAYKEFASGWLTGDNKVWGRPVDIAVDRFGNLLVLDDHAGVVYKISYDVQVRQ